MTHVISPLMANSLARLFLLSLEDGVGRSGVNAILHVAGLRQLVNRYPPLTGELAFPFRFVASTIQALGSVYDKSQHHLLLEAGYYSFNLLLQTQTALQEQMNQASAAQGIHAKGNLAIQALTQTFNSLTTTTTSAVYSATSTVYTVPECPCCWEQSSAVPCCQWLQGLLIASLNWAFDGQLIPRLNSQCIEQQLCRAAGDAHCTFLVDFHAIEMAIPFIR